MLRCLRMMDEMERRAGLYVGMNRTHSDLSVVMVVALLGKSASFWVIFFNYVCDFLSEQMSVVTTFVKVYHEFVFS